MWGITEAGLQAFNSIVSLILLLLEKIKNARRQEEHDRLEDNPGKFLSQRFSDGMRSEEENSSARAEIRKRL